MEEMAALLYVNDGISMGGGGGDDGREGEGKKGREGKGKKGKRGGARFIEHIKSTITNFLPTIITTVPHHPTEAKEATEKIQAGEQM
jgi:hypothetical protein